MHGTVQPLSISRNDNKAAQRRCSIECIAITPEFSVRFITTIGLAFFVVCLFPIFVGMKLGDLSDRELFLIAPIYRVAAIATAMPIICDSIYDIYLPHRLTYPRYLIIFALVVPNVVMLIVGSLHAVRWSICLIHATYHAFNCALFGFIASQVISKKLLLFMCFLSVFSASLNIVQVSRRFSAQQAPQVAFIAGVAGTIALVGTLSWFIYDMQHYEKRRKVFAIVYAVCGAAYPVLRVAAIITLKSIRQTDHMESITILIQIAVTIAVSVIPARMAQHDATIAMNMLESKKNFVRYISHEIRTPLNTVFMGIQLAAEQLSEAKILDAEDILRDVELSCSASIDILNDILLYDKIEDGRMELDRSEMSALRLARTVSDLFVVQARRSGVVYMQNFSDTLINTKLFIDFNKCSQVLRNLVSNALKFTPLGGSVTLCAKLIRTSTGEEVSDAAEASNGDIVFRFEVHDTGPGITQENQRLLFHNIVQFDAAALQSGGGSGLGLWISKAIMTAHGGHLGMWSTGVSGEGCVFWMEVGATYDTTGETAAAMCNYESPAVGFTSTISRTDCLGVVDLTEPACTSDGLAGVESIEVLVVDDSLLNRKMMIGHLQRLGMENIFIEQAENGQEAVWAVERRMEVDNEKRQFDIIFMDCKMPVMGGNEATARIRALGFLGPMIAVTGNGLPEDIKEILVCGSNQVIVKPVHRSDIEQTLREYCDVCYSTKPSNSVGRIPVGVVLTEAPRD